MDKETYEFYNALLEKVTVLMDDMAKIRLSLGTISTTMKCEHIKDGSGCFFCKKPQQETAWKRK